METHHRREREKGMNEYDERVQDELSLSLPFSVVFFSLLTLNQAKSN